MQTRESLLVEASEHRQTFERFLRNSMFAQILITFNSVQLSLHRKHS